MVFGGELSISLPPLEKYIWSCCDLDFWPFDLKIQSVHPYPTTSATKLSVHDHRRMQLRTAQIPNAFNGRVSNSRQRHAKHKFFVFHNAINLHTGTQLSSIQLWWTVHCCVRFDKVVHLLVGDFTLQLELSATKNNQSVKCWILIPCSSITRTAKCDSCTTIL